MADLVVTDDERCAAAKGGTPHQAHPWGYKRGGKPYQCRGVPEPDGAPPLPLDPTQRVRQQRARERAQDRARSGGRTQQQEMEAGVVAVEELGVTWWLGTGS